MKFSTTLNRIRKHRPCADGWEMLLDGLGKTAPDDEPLSLVRILEINGIEDAIWALRCIDDLPEIRLFACRCAREVLTESEFSVDNPCAYLTKAEMCLHSSVQALRGSVADTFSCDGFPVRRRQTPQCGVCTSCILRRLALFNAGLGDTDSSSYCLDLLASAETVNPPRLRGLHAMDWQVERLEHALGPQADWEGLVIEFPEMREACAALMTVRDESELVTIPQLGRLFAKHCSEWESFPVQRWIRRFSEAA